MLVVSASNWVGNVWEVVEGGYGGVDGRKVEGGRRRGTLDASRSEPRAGGRARLR